MNSCHYILKNYLKILFNIWSNILSALWKYKYLIHKIKFIDDGFDSLIVVVHIIPLQSFITAVFHSQNMLIVESLTRIQCVYVCVWCTYMTYGCVVKETLTGISKWPNNSVGKYFCSARNKNDNGETHSSYKLYCL